MDDVVLEPGEFFLALSALIADKRAAFGSCGRYSFRLLEGDAYILEPAARNMVRPGWDDDAEVLIITNQRTLSDMLLGKFDAAHPVEGQLFLWAGEDEALRRLADALGGAQSLLDFRASQGS